MKFLINSRSSESNSALHHIYDNVTNEVHDLKGNQLNLSVLCHDTGLLKKKDIKKLNPNELKTLKIQLGFKCNFRCAYCPQREFDKQIPIHVDKTTLVPSFLKRLEKTISSIENIVLIGGEPLVYIKLLKPLVKGLRDLYPKSKIHMISNGALFTKKVADWCVDNLIDITISHDGPGFKKYRNQKDILDDPCVLEGIRHYLNRVKAEERQLELAFNVVVSPENCALSVLPNYFYEKTGRHIRIQFESTVSLNDKNLKSVNSFDEKKKEVLLKQMLIAGMNNDKNKPLHSLRGLGARVAKRIISGTNLHNFPFFCATQKEGNLSVDLAGHLLVCHANPYTLTSYGNMEEFPFAEQKIFKSWTKRKNCSGCPFLVSCLGGCPLQDEISHQLSCPNKKIWHMGIFLVAWFLIFKAIIYEIRPLHTDNRDAPNANFQ